MFGLGPTELLVILFVIVLLFGANRIPELGASLGEGIKNFKKGYRESKAIDVTPPKSDHPSSSGGENENKP